MTLEKEETTNWNGSEWCYGEEVWEVYLNQEKPSVSREIWKIARAGSWNLGGLLRRKLLFPFLVFKRASKTHLEAIN